MCLATFLVSQDCQSSWSGEYHDLVSQRLGCYGTCLSVGVSVGSFLCEHNELLACWGVQERWDSWGQHLVPKGQHFSQLLEVMSSNCSLRHPNVNLCSRCKTGDCLL